jgi:hypothetical protein
VLRHRRPTYRRLARCRPAGVERSPFAKNTKNIFSKYFNHLFFTSSYIPTYTQ